MVRPLLTTLPLLLSTTTPATADTPNNIVPFNPNLQGNISPGLVAGAGPGAETNPELEHSGTGSAKDKAKAPRNADMEAVVTAKPTSEDTADAVETDADREENDETILKGNHGSGGSHGSSSGSHGSGSGVRTGGGGGGAAAAHKSGARGAVDSVMGVVRGVGVGGVVAAFVVGIV